MSVEGYDLLRETWHDVDHVNHEARHRATGRRVVVQLALAPSGATPGRRDELLERLRAVTVLDHPHLVPVLAVGEHESGAYLVRPSLAAVTLGERLRGDLPSPRQAALWGAQ